MRAAFSANGSMLEIAQAAPPEEYEVSRLRLRERSLSGAPAVSDTENKKKNEYPINRITIIDEKN